MKNWNAMTMSEQAEAWSRMTDAERRAVRPDWQPENQPQPKAAPEPAPAPAGNLNQCGACGKTVSRRAKTCPHCGEPQPDTGRRVLIAALLFICVATGIFIFGTIGSVGPSLSSSSSDPSVITYEVSGSARKANLTVSVPGGGTEQRTVYLPYVSPPYRFRNGEHVYLAAQNDGEDGTVTVKILLNGVASRSATSDTAYGIASVNGTAP